jgi:hypothetical protein
MCDAECNCPRRGLSRMKTFSGLVLLSLAVIAVALQTRANPNLSISSLEYSDTDACDVYSAVLPMDKWYWQNSRTLLIVQEIPPSEWPIGSPRDALQGTAEFSKAFAGVFKSFEAVNQQEIVLNCDFTIQKPYKMVSRDELDAAFRHLPPNAVSDGWEGFRDSFPDSSGYLILSGVGFNSDKTIALVYVEHRCGNMCGGARYYVLEKQNGQWAKCKPKGLTSEVTGTT